MKYETRWSVVNVNL